MSDAVTVARLLTLVFTDLVESTALKAVKGDRIAGELIARHRRQVDELRERWGGHVVDWAGDGCFLIFETPSTAVAFGLRLQQAHADDPALPKVRVGIHLGEVTESLEGGDVRRVEGLAVDLTARIQSLALPGQILLSSAAFNSARQRLGGEEVEAPVAWRAHGPYLLQGFDDPIDICEAGIEGLSPLTTPPGSMKAHRVATPAEEETLGWRPAIGLPVPARNHWILLRPLGEGGFGEVWLALHEKTKEKRVFKFCFELDRVRGLKREVILFRLLKEALGSREDIARVLDWQFESPPYFLESEYTEGGDLKTWAESQGGLETIDLQLRLDILAQVAEALAAAHSVGVLHKDIKPENVLIVSGQEGRPHIRLTDFGVGLITDPESLHARGITSIGLTQTLVASNSSDGTRLYMAPELIEGKPPTTLSDIYALGLLLYQMVIGDFGRTMAPGWERDIEDDLLREDIALCVDGRPERRLQSASEVAERLRRLDRRRAEQESERRLLAAAEEARRLAEKAHRRRKHAMVLAALVAASTLALVVFAFHERRRAEEQTLLHRLAESARQEAQYGRYLADIQLAAARLDQGHRISALKALLDSPPALRNWEWGYLAGQAWASPNEPPPDALRVLEPGMRAAELWAGSEAWVERELVGSGVFVAAASFSPDATMLATCSGDGIARVWDLRNGSIIKTLQADPGPLYDVAFNADGTCLGTAGWTGAVCIWELSSGKKVLALRPEGGPPAKKLEFSASGSKLLTMHYDKTACLWDLKTGQLLASYAGSLSETPSGRVSDDLKTVVTAGTDGKVCTWDAQTGLPIDVKTGPRGGSEILAPGLETVAELLEDRVILWDFATGKQLHSLEAQPQDPRVASFSRDGSYFLVACRDRATRLWDVASGRLLATLDCTTGSATFCLSCSGDGARIAIGSEDGVLTVRRPILRGIGDNKRRVLHAHDGSPSRAWFGPGSGRIVTFAFDGTAKVWSTETLAPVSVFSGHDAPILNAAFSRDGRRVHSLSSDGMLRVWDANTGSEIWSTIANPVALHESIERVGGLHSNIILDGASLIRGDCESPDGRLCLVPTDGDAAIVDAQTGEKLVTLKGCGGSTDAASFSPDGTRVTLSAHGHSETGIWDAAGGRLICSLVGHQADITMAKFCPDGRTVLTASIDGTARIWDASTGLEKRILKGGGGLFTARFSPDGTRVAAASLDCTARIWNASTGTPEAVLAGHSAYVLDALFSPDGTRILTRSADHTAKVWDLSGHDLLTLNPGLRIASAEWSSDGHRILTAHMDGTVRLWESASEEQVSAR